MLKIWSLLNLLWIFVWNLSNRLFNKWDGVASFNNIVLLPPFPPAFLPRISELSFTTSFPTLIAPPSPSAFARGHWLYLYLPFPLFLPSLPYSWHAAPYTFGWARVFGNKPCAWLFPFPIQRYVLTSVRIQISMSDHCQVVIFFLFFVVSFFLFIFRILVFSCLCLILWIIIQIFGLLWFKWLF